MDIEKLAREAGWTGIYTQWISATERESMTVPVTHEQVRRFATVVRREALLEAAKIADDTWEANSGGSEEESGWPCYAENTARAIRALADKP